MTAPFYTDDTVTLWHGDCLDVMRGMPDNSVDAVVTDPPYGLEFMGREWDAPWRGGDVVADPASVGGFQNGNGGNPYSRSRIRFGTGEGFQQWCQAWATETLRVLKPGGHMLAFGGTRTWHRLCCAVEDAGFEIRDSIAWLYGSGFPKSLDVSKAIDKAAGAEREITGLARGHIDTGGIHDDDNYVWQPEYERRDRPATDAARQWQGWGTALKPAFEPIVVARKPLTGTVAANVLEYSCGAINISACRVGPPSGSTEGSSREAGTRGCPVHGVHDLRQDGSQGAVGRSSPEMAQHLQSEMPGAADDWPAERELAGRRLDRSAEGLPLHRDGVTARHGQGGIAGAVATGSARASTGDGAVFGAAVVTAGNGSSPQWSEDGQPAGESASDRLGNPLQRARPDRARVEQAASGEPEAERCTCGAWSDAVAGRWPANVALDDTTAAELDKQSGTTTSPQMVTRGGQRLEAYGMGRQENMPAPGDSGGASRFFFVTNREGSRLETCGNANTASENSSQQSEPDGSAPSDAATSDSPEGISTVPLRAPSMSGTANESKPNADSGTPPILNTGPRSSPESQPLRHTRIGSRASDAEPPELTDTTTTTANPSRSDGYAGGATSPTTSIQRGPGAAALPIDSLDSRFIYTAKADSTERPRLDGQGHPTVKPLDLMRWLVRLVTPPGGVVLDPFLGSGTTAEACIIEHFHCIGIERDDTYIRLAKTRLAKPIEPVLGGL